MEWALAAVVTAALVVALGADFASTGMLRGGRWLRGRFAGPNQLSADPQRDEPAVLPPSGGLKSTWPVRLFVALGLSATTVVVWLYATIW